MVFIIINKLKAESLVSHDTVSHLSQDRSTLEESRFGVGSPVLRVRGVEPLNTVTPSPRACRETHQM
jgi:hypothetical protein